VGVEPATPPGVPPALPSPTDSSNVPLVNCGPPIEDGGTLSAAAAGAVPVAGTVIVDVPE
jgi:hypothetical protein